MAKNQKDPFSSRSTFSCMQGEIGICRLSRLEEAGYGTIDRLPYSIRILLESVLRNCDGRVVTEEDVKNLAGWEAAAPQKVEIPFIPARVVLQDFTGVPAVVDLAAMRSAMQRLGGDPKKINPLIPVDLVIDHSVQVDKFAIPGAIDANVALEFKRNRERYEFLRWGQSSLDNFRVVPPNTGIVHQVNLEYLAKGVFVRDEGEGPMARPDTLVGTDSHTTMINGLGVIGWGVGGIEAEAAMLGQPLYMLLPEVVGMELTGELPPGVTATDMVLTVVEALRREGVVAKFVEFFGSGIRNMSLADRATIANMAPEYGATMGFFPVDEVVLDYLRRTGRTEEEVDLVERYTKEQGIFRTADAPTPEYTKTLSLDLSSLQPSLAGPKRPQDRIPLSQMQSSWRDALSTTFGKEPSREAVAVADPGAEGVEVEYDGSRFDLKHGDVVIAAITSCTNTSNPSVMIAAGLLAKKAIDRGLAKKPWVKTSLAPGSRVVTDYLNEAGLSESLDQLGFRLVGYGCTTCIGNSGPLPTPLAEAITEHDLVAAAVLSGNRNFEGRISPHVKANYLASPPLVVAYALAGTTDIDLTSDPIGQDASGGDVYLADIWPTREEIDAAVESAVQPEMFRNQYSNAFDSNAMWNAIARSGGDLYDWNEKSTYIQEPPFLQDITLELPPVRSLQGARVLALLGDSVTTDHISPAGAIAPSSPAGRHLQEQGVQPTDFNSYGSRRGNDRVMVRGTLANIRIRNQLAPGTEGGITRHLPDGEEMSIYDAAMQYKKDNIPLVILAGTEYGTGSSRDWAAKGTMLLGVQAVIASSFERIHRSNLVGMGILPLQFPPGETWGSLGLTGEEEITIAGLDDSLAPLGEVEVSATAEEGKVIEFRAQVRIDTPVELEYYRNGGILQTVLRNLAKE